MYITACVYLCWVYVFSLSNLFCGLDESSPLRYVVYMALIKLAGHANLIHILNPKPEEIKNWLTMWDVGMGKGQALLRSLYEAFTECRQRYCIKPSFFVVILFLSLPSAAIVRNPSFTAVHSQVKKKETLLFIMYNILLYLLVLTAH